MKKSLLITMFVAIAVAAGFFALPKNGTEEVQNEGTSEGKPPKEQRIADALEWRRNTLINLETGEFDPADLNKAVAKANSLQQNAFKKNGVLNLEWEALGPDNQGGRTRAILFDKDDPNLLFAAGVAGGIYKSTDLGDNWTPLDSYDGFASVVSITQANDNFGTIYVGTGEGLSQAGGTPVNSGQYGNGIYMSQDKGETWQQLSNTEVVTSGVAPNTSFGLVNDLAVSPVNSSVIIAATGSGLRVSSDAQNGVNMTFTTPPGVSSGQGEAIEFASDGSYAIAVISGRVYRSDDVVGNFQTAWTQITAGLPTGSGRGDIDIAPSNKDYVYFTKATSGGACLEGVYRSTDGGLSFTQIVDAGSPYELDPFNQPTAEFGECAGQGWYDQTVEVNPIDENKIYIGGITTYTWGAGTGGMKKADIIDTEGGTFFDANYIHADKHEIVFSPHDPTGNTMIIGNDGGMVISTNARSGFPDNIVYRGINKNFNTLQIYGMGAGRFGEVICGTQDNGSQYIDYLGASIQSAHEVSGGDGGFGEVSNFDYNVLFSTTYYANIYRSINRGQSVNNFVDDNIDGAACGHVHCNNNSACGEGDGAFVTAFHLMETSSRPNPPLTAYVFARDDTLLLSTGETLIVRDTIPAGPVEARSGNVSAVTFPEVLGSPLMPGDTAFFPDPFDAKYFVSTSCGIWMCRNPLEVSEQAEFYRLTSSGSARNYDSSTDGDNLYTVLGDGRLIIYSGLSGLTLPPGGCDNDNGACVSGYTTTTINVGNNLQLFGVAVDKNDPTTVLVTSSGFGSVSKVYRVEDVFSGSPVITSLQPNDNTLPYMPIHSCAIDANNPDRYILGTELGIWTSDDAGQTWSEDNSGFGARLPIFSLRQEWVNSYWGKREGQYNFDEDCYVLYAGTHGRGFFATGTLAGSCWPEHKGNWPGEITSIKDIQAEVNQVTMFPNPASSIADIVFNLDRSNMVNLKIVDMTGRVVHTQVYPGMNAGMNSVKVNVSNLSSGNYIAVLSTNGNATSSVKFVKN